MGIELVKAVVGHPATSSLSGNAYKVLVCMATTALDKAKDGRPGGLYFGGWDALAITLGYPNADAGTPGKTVVKRAISELRKHGHITPMTVARTGSRQSYLVHPGGLSVGVDFRPPQGVTDRPPVGVDFSTDWGSQSDPPRKESGINEGLTQDEQPRSATQPQTADKQNDDEGMAAHKFEGQPGDQCHACGGHYMDRTAHPLRLLKGYGA